MRMLISVVGCLVLFCGCALRQESPHDANPPHNKVIIETSQPMPSAGFLGTVDYAPTKQEEVFLKKIDEVPLVGLWANEPAPSWASKELDPAKVAQEEKEQRENLRKAQEYTLAGQVGRYVGWFGIVREKICDKDRGATRLLLEHKYFDGLTDSHIQVVSIYGAGDFVAFVPGDVSGIPMLSLVRICGKVSKTGEGLPEISPEYIRVWDWGLFTFMDYGVDKTNPKWVALRKVAGNEVYKSRVSRSFYEERLGTRE